MMQDVTLLSPGSLQGFASALSPTVLPANQASLIQNLRTGDGTLRARWGDYLLNNTFGTLSVRGAASLVLNGTPYLFVAFSDGTHVSIYASSNDGVTFTLLSNGSVSGNPYFDDRMTDAGQVYFSVIQDRARDQLTDYDLMIAQNGVDLPRVWGPSTADSTAFGSGVNGMSVMYQPPIVPVDNNLSVTTAFKNFLNIADATQPTYVNGDVTMLSLQNNSASPTANYIYGQLFSTYTGTISSTVTFHSPMDLSQSSQFVLIGGAYQSTGISGATNATPIVIQTATAHNLQTGETVGINSVIGNTAANGSWVVTVVDSTHFSLNGSAGNGAWSSGGNVISPVGQNFWGSVKVTLTDTSGNTCVLYDPTAANGNPIILAQTSAVANYEGLLQIGYSVPATTPFVFTAVKKVAFQWMGNAPVAPIKFFVSLMAAGGAIQGTSSFAVAYQMSDARCTGPSQIVTTNTAGSVGLSGGPSVGVGLPVPTITDDPRFYFDYIISISNTSSGVLAKGVDMALCYANYPGQTGYYLVNVLNIANWDVSLWVFTSGSAGSAVTFSQSFFTQQFSHPSLGSDALILPTGSVTVTANGRTFVCGNARFWFSDYETGFVFRMAVQFVNGSPVDNSGGSMARDGETFQSLVALGSYSGSIEDLSSPIVGSATLYVLSDQAMYSLSGFSSTSLSRLIPICPHGTKSPFSIGRSERGFYWLDQRGQICFYGSVVPFNAGGPYASINGFRQLSVAIVDNLTTTIPASRRKWASGSCLRNRYYLAFTPSGGSTNTDVMVYYEKSAQFESIDSGAASAEFMVAHQSAILNYVEMIRFGVTTVYEYEQPNLASSVAVGITFGEIHDPTWSSDAFAEQFSILSDANSGGMTYTCSRYFPSEGSTVSGTIAISGSSLSRILAVEPVGIGGSGQSVQPSISGTVNGGTRIYMVRMSSGPASTSVVRA